MRAPAHHRVTLGSQSWPESLELSFSSWVTAFAVTHN